VTSQYGLVILDKVEPPKTVISLIFNLDILLNFQSSLRRIALSHQARSPS